MRHAIWLAGLLATLAGAFPAAAQTFKPVLQFDVHGNPNGVWSYLAAGALLTKHSRSCAGESQFICWQSGKAIPNNAIVGANKTDAALSLETIVLPAHTIALDPEYQSPAVVQWTAPAAGTATVEGHFVGVDTHQASHDVAVLHNGTALATYTIDRYGRKRRFTFTVTVAAGDTIGFASYARGYAYLTTGLRGHISLAPN